MKTVNVRDLQKKVKKCVQVSQKEHVVVTVHGRPAAIVIGVEGDDWEDVFYRTSPAFWKMIQERRKEKTVPLAQVKKRLEAKWAREKRKA
jgi:prevent-host-death family protein